MEDIDPVVTKNHWNNLLKHDRACLVQLRACQQLLGDAKRIGTRDEAQMKELSQAVEDARAAKLAQEVVNHQLMQNSADMKVKHLMCQSSLHTLSAYIANLQNPNLADTLDMSLSSMMEQLEKKYEQKWDDNDNDDDVDVEPTESLAQDEGSDLELLDHTRNSSSEDSDVEGGIRLFNHIHADDVRNDSDVEADTSMLQSKPFTHKVDVNLALAGNSDEEQQCFLNALKEREALLKQRNAGLLQEIAEAEEALQTGLMTLHAKANRLHVLTETQTALEKLTQFYTEVCTISDMVDKHAGADKDALLDKVDLKLQSPNLVLGHKPQQTRFVQTADSQLEPVDVCVVASAGVPATPGQFFHNIIGQAPLKFKHVRFHRLDIPEELKANLVLPATLQPQKCFFVLFYKHHGVKGDVNTIDWQDKTLMDFLQRLPANGQKMLIVVREQKVLNNHPLPLKWLSPSRLPKAYRQMQIVAVGNADHDASHAWKNTYFNNKMYRDVAQAVRERCDGLVLQRIVA